MGCPSDSLGESEADLFGKQKFTECFFYSECDFKHEKKKD